MYDINVERSYPTPFANSPLLPMLLWALSSQSHTPRTKSEFEDEYDYIVVGAGSAGSVVASRLSEIPCVKVLLLEAGGDPPLLTDLPFIAPTFINSQVDWKYLTVPQNYTGAGFKNKQLTWARGKMIGGTGSINFFQYIRGNKKDYDDWAAMGAKGWSYKDVLPYFKKLEDERDKRYKDAFHGVGGPVTMTTQDYISPMKESLFEALKDEGYEEILDPNGARQTGGFITQQTVRNGQRCSPAKAYLVPAENRNNLDILSNAYVRKVVIKNNRAVGVEVDIRNKPYFVSARAEVIMSAGTTNTPQILMLSGVGPKSELEKFNIHVHADLHVGKNLHDHSQSFLMFEVTKDLKPVVQRIKEESTVNHYIATKSGILNSFNAMGMEAFVNNDNPDPHTDHPTIQAYFTESDAKALNNLMQFTPEVYNQVFAPYENKALYACEAVVMDPKSRGYITLKSRDPYDKPIIDPNILADDEDFETLVKAMKFCNRIGTSKHMIDKGWKPFTTKYPGCEKFYGNDDLYFPCVVRLIGSVGNHQVGTAKMGRPCDPTTVVDSQLRVKGIAGLRVIDASIMPKIPLGNTNVPTMMIAEKGSDMIKETITCRGSAPHWEETSYAHAESHSSASLNTFSRNS